MSTHQSTQLVYDGKVITHRADDLCLTDMWKAAGSPENKRPAEWARYEGAAFIAFVAETQNVGMAHIIKSQRGKNGSTYAHWQVGIAYAKYLDHGFHMWANTAVREKMEGKLPALPADIVELLRRDDGMLKQVIHKVTIMEKAHSSLRDELNGLRERVQSPAACTANDLWKEAGFPPLRGGSVWLGNRLLETGCAPEFGSRMLVGGRWYRMFDAGRARLQMKNGLRLLTDRYVSERMGQGKLKLVSSA